MTCGWGCTGCGWRGSSPRSARPICGSLRPRRGSCWRRPGWHCPSRAGDVAPRAEGWAAGLRLAALSLAGHEDPERFAAEFSGSERTVAEYLLAEVLERQPARGAAAAAADLGAGAGQSGSLADVLTGGEGGEWMLQELEEANAFVVSLDAARSWFRYHRLFATCCSWSCGAPRRARSPRCTRQLPGGSPEHGFAVEAIRHAQAAGDWGLAARLLADHWPGLQLGGQAATVHDDRRIPRRGPRGRCGARHARCGQ